MTNLPILLHSSESEQTAPFLNWCNTEADGGNAYSGFGTNFGCFFSSPEFIKNFTNFCKYKYDTNNTIKKTMIRKNL